VGEDAGLVLGSFEQILSSGMINSPRYMNVPNTALISVRSNDAHTLSGSRGRVQRQ